jgi:catechol 1,2-dioxygenase
VIHAEHDLADTNSEELILRPDARPTISYDEDEHYHLYLRTIYVESGSVRPPTESDVLGPYFRKGAPYRAKVTPPNEPGTALLISGRVWGIDSRRPLNAVTIDIWQANAEGHYDNENPQHPPPPHSFKNRVRLVTDEHGRYEFETVHPGPYKMDASTWRSPHVHYRVQREGYTRLITQLFFRGDPYEDSDPFFKQSLTIQLMQEMQNGKPLEIGIFDIVLASVIS